MNKLHNIYSVIVVLNFFIYTITLMFGFRQVTLLIFFNFTVAQSLEN